MNDGFILIHRKIIKEWEWYSNINDTRLWLHCLLKANWEDSWFEGIKIERGSFVTSLKKLSLETELTERQIRTSLEHLKSTNNLTINSNNKFSIITINNYDKYQLATSEMASKRQAIDKQATSKRQASDNNIINNNKEQLITINNNKLYKEENIIKEEKRKYGEFKNVFLTDDEYQKLKDKFYDYEEKIERLSSYIASKGTKYKSHYATILNWSRKDEKENIKKKSNNAKDIIRNFSIKEAITNE